MQNDSERHRRRAERIVKEAMVDGDAIIEAHKAFQTLSGQFVELVNDRSKEHWLPRLRKGETGESDAEIRRLIDESVRTIDQLAQGFPKMIKDSQQKLQGLELAAERDGEVFVAMLKILADNMKYRRQQAEREVKQLNNLITLLKSRTRPK